MIKGNTYRAFQQLIEKYLDQELSPAEMKKLINYYESFQESHEWVKELGPEDVIKRKMLQNILDTINEDATPKRIPLYKKKVFRYSIAASIAVLIGVSFFFKDRFAKAKVEQTVVNSSIEGGTGKATLTLENGKEIDLVKGENYITNSIKSDGEKLVYGKEINPTDKVRYNYLTVPRGGEFFVELSDGTKVWLNSESKLKYPVQFVDGQSREVELVYGEAYFDVSPSSAHQGSAFKVFTNGQEIEVLGTEFNLNAYQNESFVYTTLIEGSVSLKTALESEVLKPGEQSILNKNEGSVEVETVDTYFATAWKKGLFAFKNKSLKEIMTVLSRWYDVDIIIEDEGLETTDFKGVLSKNQTIEQILELIKSTNHINAYEIKENTIIIKK